MLIHAKCNDNKYITNFVLHLNDNISNIVQYYTFLGIAIDKKLYWKKHIEIKLYKDVLIIHKLNIRYYKIITNNL